MNYFTINDREYKAKEFDFNLICELEDMGISLEKAAEKPMSMVRAYFGICANMSKDRAGKEMEQHIINGGKFDDIMKAMSAEMEKSDFFRQLNSKAAEKEARKGKTAKAIEVE